MTAAEAGPQAPHASPRRAWIAAGAVSALALVVRLTYLAHLAETPFWDELSTVIDARYYVERATEMADGDLVGRNAAFLSPGYVGFQALVRTVFGEGLAAAKVAQAVIGALSCGLLVVLGSKTVGLRAGALGGALFTVYGMHIYYAGLLLPATLTVFLNIALLTALVPWSGPPGNARTALAGVLTGLAALTKANALLLVPVALVLLAIWCRRHGRWVFVGRAGWFVVGVALAIAPVTWANERATGEFVLLNTTGGRNLYKGNGPHANGSHIYLPEEERGVSLASHLSSGFLPEDAVADDARFRGETWEYVSANPGPTLALLGKKALLLLNAQELGVRNHAFVRQQVPLLRWPWLSFALLVPLGLTGLILCAPRRRTAPLALALAVQLVSFTLVFVLARYRLVAVALLSPFAGWLLCEWIALIRARTWSRIAISAGVLAAAVAVVHLPSTGIDPRHEDGTVWKFLGDRHSDAGNPAAAIEAYSTALSTGLDTSRPHLRFQVLWRLAEAYVAEGAHDRAVNVLTTLIAELQVDIPGPADTHGAKQRPRSEALLAAARSRRRELRGR